MRVPGSCYYGVVDLGHLRCELSCFGLSAQSSAEQLCPPYFAFCATLGLCNRDRELYQHASSPLPSVICCHALVPVVALLLTNLILCAGKRPPSLFALNTKSWQVHQIQGLESIDASWGQPTWTPDGKGLVAVAWPHKALNFPGSTRRLGIVHCYNRPCELYYIPYKAPEPAAADSTADGTAGSTGSDVAGSTEDSSTVPVKVSGGVGSGLSPVFSPGGGQLLFISQEAAVSSGVHAATSSLYALTWAGEVRLVLAFLVWVSKHAAVAHVHSNCRTCCTTHLMLRLRQTNIMSGLYQVA
jgi:hypothetical protein